MKKYNREDITNALVQRNLDEFDDQTYYNILREGCNGYDNMNEREILEHFLNYVYIYSDDEDTPFQYENAEGSILEVVPIADGAGPGIKIDGVVDDYQYI